MKHGHHLNAKATCHCPFTRIKCRKKKYKFIDYKNSKN